MMASTRRRFDAAIADYKRVTARLRAWEVAQRGSSAEGDARRLARTVLNGTAGPNLVALHEAFWAAEKEASAVARLDAVLGIFESSVRALDRKLDCLQAPRT